MRADTQMARSKIAPLQRPNTLMQLSRSSVLKLRLATRGRAIHTGTSWSQPDVLVCKALKSGPCRLAQQSRTQIASGCRFTPSGSQRFPGCAGGKAKPRQHVIGEQNRVDSTIWETS